MERPLDPKERNQLTDIADQWKRTENKTTQNRVLQNLVDYTKLFFSRLERPERVSFNGSHESSFTSHSNGGGNPNKAVRMLRTEDDASRLDSRKPSQPQRSRQHAFNPSIDPETDEKARIIFSGEKNAKLESILQIGNDTVELEELIRVFDEEVVCAGVDMSHPTCFVLVPGCGHLLYSVSQYLASITHIPPLARFSNAAACDIEKSVLRWVTDIIGYPEEARGTTVSGTSTGAVIAFSTARFIKLENSKQFSRSVVYMTDLAHFCHTRALRIVGLTDVVLRQVPTRKHRMNAEELEKLITADYKAGLCPFMVIGTAGSASLGTIDPMRAISEVAKKHGLWFHVDAAMAGFLMLEQSVKKKCEGVNMADSITLDFHKALSAPYGTAAVFVRNGSHLRSTMARESAPFFPNVTGNEKYSPIEFTFELSRPFRAFPVWFMMKTLGTAAVTMAMREKMRLTKYALKAIRAMTNVVTCMEPDLTVIAFRYFQPGNEDKNDVTRRWHELIADEGQICLTSTTENGLFYIRMCILSFRTHLEDIDIALASIEKNLSVVLREKEIFVTKL